MEHFRNAKMVRLLSRHNKYLTADDDDEDGVRQHRNGASRGAKWEVELVDGGRMGLIRLKSCCFNRYLAASNKRFLLGATGKKVVLLPLPPKAKPEGLGESVEWQPIPDGTRCVKLQTKEGTFLRANGFVKPYENTVTHGNPRRTVTQDWVFWEVDVIEMVHDTTTETSPTAAGRMAIKPPPTYVSYPARAVVPVEQIEEQRQSVGVSTAKVLAPVPSVAARSHTSTKSDISAVSSRVSEADCGYTPSRSSSRSSSVDTTARPTRFLASSEKTRTVPAGLLPESLPDRSSTTSSSPPPSPHPPPSPNISPPLPRSQSSLEGLVVHYYFADDYGEVDDSFGCGSLLFHGSTAQELIHNVETETGVDNFILCTRNIINDRLYRLSLNLPLTTDRESMTVFIVHPDSKVAKHIF